MAAPLPCRLRSPRGPLARGLALLALGLLPPRSGSQAAEAPALRIAGRVELPAGASPAARAAARVELVSALDDYETAKRELAGSPPPPPLVSAHPDAAGAFVLLAPHSGCYRVRVRADGTLPVEHLLLPLVDDADLPPVHLAPAIPASVRVMGSDGKPLAGLRLSVTGGPSSWWTGQEVPAWRTIERSGRTDAEGRLSFSRAKGESLAVKVVDLRHLGATLGVPEPAAAGAGRPAEATLHLARRPALVLAARDPAGRPVDGALLRFGDGRPAAIAGSDGRLEVSFEDPRWAGGEGVTTLESPSGALSGQVDWRRARGGLLPVVLAPLLDLAGWITEKATGAPVGGGLVWIERTDWTGAIGVAAVATAGADGRFRLRAHTADNLQPRAAARGYLPARPDEPNGAAPWRIALDRAATLTGIVVDAAGQGVAGAGIGFRQPQLPFPPPPRAVTGLDGRFQLPNVAVGERYQLEVSAPGFAPTSASVRVPRPERGKVAAPVRIVLEPGRSLAGRVVDEAGQPLPGVAIKLLRSDFLPLAHWRSWPADGSAWETVTDAGGGFEVRHLAAGRYGLAAHGTGFATTLRDGIDLPPGNTPYDLGHLVVPRGAALAGRVTDRRGAPVAEATIEYSPSPKGLPTQLESSRMLGGSDAAAFAQTGPDGRFEISGLRRGEAIDLKVRAEGHPQAALRDVRAPTAEPLAIELADGGRLSGRVIDGERRPVFGGGVSGQESGPVEDRGLRDWGVGAGTDARGEFSLAGLSAGAVDLRVEAEGYRASRVRGLEIAAGRETTGVEVVLDAGSSLAGHLRDAAGKPMSRASVSAQREISRDDVLALMTGEQTMSLVAARTAPDGAYRLDGLETGRYEVSAGSSRQSVRATVDIQPGENTLDLVAETHATAAVSGRVLDVSGAPVAGASVSLEADASPGAYPVSSLADGSFVLSSVAPGQYRLSAGGRGFVTATYPEPVVVADAAVEGLEITLERVTGVIRGRLSGLDLAELLRARVTALTLGMRDGSQDRPARGDASQQLVTGRVDAAGAYRIDDLAPGQWSVTALTDSGHRASGMVTLEAGGPEGHLDLDFAVGATLTGRVTIDGRPVAGAQVVVAVEDMSKAPAQSDTASDGTFRISGIEPATYALLVVDPTTFTTSFSMIEIAGDRDVAVDLTTGAIHGRVLTAAGDPVAGAQVALEGIDPPRPARMAQPTATTGDDGSFAIPSVAAGRYQVTASKEGLEPGQATVQVTPHGTARVEIRLAHQP